MSFPGLDSKRKKYLSDIFPVNQFMRIHALTNIDYNMHVLNCVSIVIQSHHNRMILGPNIFRNLFI